ncbi:MAG: hypothetical protein K8J31_03435 [Anaerolineae bacterium]|nr:hypothetical protein [Anaerolineae bacterium]
MNTDEKLIGIVQQGKFHIFSPASAKGKSVRLAKMSIMAAMLPEHDEIDLTKHENKVLMVSSHHCDDDWGYSAEIVEEAGPILTAVVQVVFDPSEVPGA